MESESGKFYNLFNKKYDAIKRSFSITYKKATGESIDEDIFHDTIIKCGDILTDDKTMEMSEKSIIDYTYIAYKHNMLRSKNYIHNKNTVIIDIDETIPDNGSTDYWDMRCEIKDFIVENFGEDTFEECCQWIIDRKSVQEIEAEHNDKCLYYKFKKIKELVIKHFGEDLYDIPRN